VRTSALMVALAISTVTLGPLYACTSGSTQPSLNGHAIVLDSDRKLLSWAAPQEGAYGRVVTLA